MASFRISYVSDPPVSFSQFIDDPFLRSEQNSCPVQLPLAISGWGFKEEFSAPAVKMEKVEEDNEPMEATVEGSRLLSCVSHTRHIQVQHLNSLLQ